MEKRVIVVAPSGNDARHAVMTLTQAGFTAEAFSSISSAAEAVAYGCGAFLFTEESLTTAQKTALGTVLTNQPKWSNLPLVLITSGGAEKLGHNVRRGFDPRFHITLLERPLRMATLLAAVEAALGSREQQYEIRDLLKEREDILNSLEALVQERTIKLQAMVHEMEAFSYSVSHDLRAPLRVLAGYAEAIQEDYASQLPAEGHRLLSRISSTAKRMDGLTQDLLAYTRIASGELKLERVDLDELADSVLESYSSLHEARQYITLKPPLGVCLGHAPSLTQCFSNLLENAIKFTRPGELPKVEVFSTQHEGTLRISFLDHGIGIVSSEGDRIFELFERGEGHAPGTGIGLAIVKKAAERMQGKVGMKSIPDCQTEFWIELNLFKNDSPLRTVS